MLFKEDWVPFVCGTDVSIAITSGKLAIRTKGDGVWKKYTYQDLDWSVTLSGLLTFDEDQWTGWDMLDNQFNFAKVLMRVSFSDSEGNTKSLQGYAMIETSTLSYSPGNMVKDDFQLQGNGKMIMYDGLVPCDTEITTISVTGQTAADGIVHFDYTFTGPVYQVKYRIDGQGEYRYAIAGVTIDVPGLVNANHEVEIIPVCQNDYEGIGTTQRFQVTHAQTCSSSIDSITVDTTNFTITNTHSGPATQMRYRIDGGIWIDSPINASISISGIDPGFHTVEEVPVCSNGVSGTGRTQTFTVASQPASSRVNWQFVNPVGSSNYMQIYVRGTLVVSASSSASGSFMAPVGDLVRSVVYGSVGTPTRNINLKVQDMTTMTVLHDDTVIANSIASATEDYTFRANGDLFSITGTIST